MTSQDTVYIRAINEGILGFGESYMDGDWDAEDIPAVFYKIFANDAPILRMFMNPWNRFLYYMQFSFFNLQTKQRVYDVAKIHYDLGRWKISKIECLFLQIIFYKIVKNTDKYIRMFILQVFLCFFGCGVLGLCIF